MKSKTSVILNIAAKPFEWGLQNKCKYYTATTFFMGLGWFIVFAVILYIFKALNVWMGIFLFFVCVLAGVAFSAITWWLYVGKATSRLKKNKGVTSEEEK